MNNLTLIKKLRRSANWGLYGSIAVILLAVIFHFSPYHITYQSPQVSRWMLISGTILAVLAIVMMLLTVRKTTPTLRQLDNLDDKVKGYHAYISNLYSGTLAIVFIECVLIVLMSDTSLLMVTILMVLVLFICYPNMYKMKHDLGLTRVRNPDGILILPSPCPLLRPYPLLLASEASLSSDFRVLKPLP